MSDTIFLRPTTLKQKTVFVQVKNTSDKQQISIEPKLKEYIMQKGYTISSDPENAHYFLQANILQVGKSDLRDANEALHNGYGSMLTGAITGGVVGALASDNDNTILAGGLIGAAISHVGNALIKDVSYSMITDIQISERSKKVATEHENSKLKQGSHGEVILTSSNQTYWKRYQTRILSSANQVNLKFEEAVPELVAGLSRSISGLM